MGLSVIFAALAGYQCMNKEIAKDDRKKDLWRMKKMIFASPVLFFFHHMMGLPPIYTAAPDMWRVFLGMMLIFCWMINCLCCHCVWLVVDSEFASQMTTDERARKKWKKFVMSLAMFGNVLHAVAIIMQIA